MWTTKLMLLVLVSFRLAVTNTPPNVCPKIIFPLQRVHRKVPLELVVSLYTRIWFFYVYNDGRIILEIALCMNKYCMFWEPFCRSASIQTKMHQKTHSSSFAFLKGEHEVSKYKHTHSLSADTSYCKLWRWLWLSEMLGHWSDLKVRGKQSKTGWMRWELLTT